MLLQILHIIGKFINKISIPVDVQLNLMMEVLRERLFISHDSSKQRQITAEYTIRSNRENLTNIIILSEDFLPNLMVRDEHNNIMSIMPNRYVKILLSNFIEKTGNELKEQLENILQKINPVNCI